MAEVRRATPADFPAMVAMGRALHDESPHYRDKPFNPDKLLRLGARLTGTLLVEDAILLVATAGGGGIVGMAIGFLAERWFNDERFLTDLTVYVKPEHRGSSAFYRLIKTMEAWAEGQGVTDKALGVSTEIDPERTVCAYERMGYRLAGYTMVK